MKWDNSILTIKNICAVLTSVCILGIGTFQVTSVQNFSPARCVLCYDKDLNIYHAPCVIDLSTGDLFELAIYERGPMPGELASI